MRKLLSILVLSLVLLVVYTAYTGRTSSITLVTGLVVSLIMSLFIVEKRVVEAFNFRSVLKIPYLFEYLYRFVIAEIKEHVEVAKIILSTKTRIRPGLVKIPLRVESDTAMAILALTITNTPGTIAVHLDVNEKTMLVHWINIKTDDPIKAKEAIVGEFEHLARKVFER